MWNTKNMNDFTHIKFWMPERAHVKGKWVRKTCQHESMVEWPMFLGFCFPKDSKHVSQKLMSSPIRIWAVIPCPSHAITNPTNF